MYAISGPHSLSLAKGAVLTVPDIAGLQVVCRQGSVWLTLDHDLRDVVLECGERFDGLEHRRALLYALEPACVALRPVPVPAARSPSRWRLPAWPAPAGA